MEKKDYDLRGREIMMEIAAFNATTSGPGVVNRSPAIIGIALAGLSIGTGGSLTSSSWAQLSQRVSVTSVSCEVSTSSNNCAPASEQVVLNLQEKLAAIQHYFSINIKELALILEVSRPTVYSWLRAEQEPQAANIRRIGDLYSLIQDWQKISIKPVGSFVRAPLFADKSLIDLLADKTLHKASIGAAFEKIGVFLAERRDTTKRTVASRRLEIPTNLQRELLTQEFGI